MVRGMIVMIPIHNSRPGGIIHYAVADWLVLRRRLRYDALGPLPREHSGHPPFPTGLLPPPTSFPLDPSDGALEKEWPRMAAETAIPKASMNRKAASGLWQLIMGPG
jgi:hypothetical protein